MNIQGIQGMVYREYREWYTENTGNEYTGNTGNEYTANTGNEYTGNTGNAIQGIQ